MSGRRALIPRKVMDDAAAVSVATNSIIEVEGKGFRMRITPARGMEHLNRNSDDLDERIARGEGF